MLQACTVLYDALPELDAGSQQGALERLVGPCAVEWAGVGPEGGPLMGGVAAFGEHQVAMVALPAPVRPEVLDVTVEVSPMPDDERQAMREHRAAIRVLYVGSEQDPVEQLVAMYRVAGVLLDLGGVGVINERAALAQPFELAAALISQLGDDPLPIQLWTGAITFALGQNEAVSRLLVRTYGMDQCNLPEFAIYIRDRLQADDAYHALMNVCLYFVQDRVELTLGLGDRVEFIGHTYLLAEPDRTISELDSESGLFLLIEV